MLFFRCFNKLEVGKSLESVAFLQNSLYIYSEFQKNATTSSIIMEAVERRLKNDCPKYPKKAHFALFLSIWRKNRLQMGTYAQIALPNY